MIPGWLLNITQPAVQWVDSLPEWLGAGLCFLFVSVLFVLSVLFLRWTEQFADRGGFWSDRTKTLNPTHERKTRLP